MRTACKCRVSPEEPGEGSIGIEGYATYNPNIALNLTAKGHDIRLRYPPGVSSMADADLRLSGSAASAVLSGDITITRFGVNPQFDFASYLAQSKQVESVSDPSSFPAKVRLDVRVLSPPELQVQTSLAKVSGDVDLHLRGVASRPVLLGRINIMEGDIDFNATKYHLERGGITFNNPIATQPILDIEATTTVRDYDITLGFHGPADKLSTTYRSDPPLATADIVSLLAFGQTREETAAQIGAERLQLDLRNPEHPVPGLECGREQSNTETVWREPDQDRSASGRSGEQPRRTAPYHRTTSRQQPDIDLHHRCGPGQLPDHPGGVQREPQCFHSGDSRLERGGQLRCPHPPAPAIAAGGVRRPVQTP